MSLDGRGHELELELQPGMEGIGLLDQQVGSLRKLLLACLLVRLPIFCAHVLSANGRCRQVCRDLGEQLVVFRHVYPVNAVKPRQLKADLVEVNQTCRPC